ncbi:ATP-binding protein [Actinophytocola sediminis]
MNGHGPIATWPIPRQLPGDVPTFVGRSAALHRLDALLPGRRQATTAVISAVAGSAGVGKTALALRWAHLARASFPDGDLFADLQGYGFRSRVGPAQVLDSFLRAMDVPAARIPTSLDAQTGLYRSMLRERRVLVVLDNAASTEDVRPLLPGSPTCVVLVTSRSRLSGLVARDGAHRVTLDMLPADEAVELLREIIGADRADAEPAALAELAARCGYLPLALRIAAERVLNHPQWTLADLSADLANEHDRLDVLSTDDDETTTVRAVFSWSYRALPPPTARMFRLLGLHHGAEISTDAAASLAGNTPAAARRLLDSLANLHMIAEVARDRYRFHDLLRVYAAERAEHDEPADERTEATRRMLDWYLHAAEAADKALSPHRERVPLPAPTRRPPTFADYDQAWDWCETERANLVAATRLAEDVGESDVAWRMPGALLTYFTHRNPRTDWLISHEVGLRASRQAGDRYGEAWMLTSLSLVYRELRRFDEAMTCLRDALPLWRAVGVRWAEGWVLFDIGFLYHERQEFEQALDYLWQALAVRRDAGDRWGEGSTLNVLAGVLHRLDRLDESLDYAEQALVLQRATDNARGVAGAIHTIGLVYRALGRLDDADERLHTALAMRREMHNYLGEAATLRSIGELRRERGDLAGARESWRQALAILERLDNPDAAEVRVLLATLA